MTESAVPTNSAGSGNVAGIGVGPKGEPGVAQKKRKRLRQIVPSAVRRPSKTAR